MTTMIPETTEVLMQEKFQTVEELQGLLARAMEVTGRSASEVYVEIAEPSGDDAEFILEAEGLTDRSVVYNIRLR